MNHSTKKQWAALGLGAAVATAGLAVAGPMAVASDGDRNAQGAPRVGKVTARTADAIACDGGKALQLKTRIANAPFTFAETGVNDQDQAVPGAHVVIIGPREGRDTVLVTFSAETQLTGGDVNDWMGLEVHLDGVPINPFTAGSDKLALTGEPSWNSNSMQFCAKVGPGHHRLQAFANLHDSSGSHSLSGWLDDYTFSVVKYS
jgi:hypothetical protein